MEGPPGSAPLPATLRLVDYVPAVHPADAQRLMRRWPDVLRDLPSEGFQTCPGESSALWLEVRVPAAAMPGEYTGAVRVTPGSGETQALPVQLRVYDIALPSPTAWQFRVDFWQGFGRLATRYGVEQWGPEWWDLTARYVADLAAHGQSVVQVGRGHFDWVRKPDGSWEFGFARFDRYMELCESAGIRGMIEYLQMFDGRAETTLWWTGPDGQSQSQVANPGDEQFDQAWGAFAGALADHCREKGWLDRLYICPTDEPQDVYGQPTLDRFRHCVELLRRADQAHRVTVALDSLDSARALAPGIDRFVFKLRADTYDAAWARELVRSGKLVDVYICCHPDRPNSFITSEPIEQRAIGWICWRDGVQGVLRWSYTDWPDDPFGKPEGDGAYAPGDLFIVYPGDEGPLATPRWERMRGGFQDYEMLRAVARIIETARAGPEVDAARALLAETVARVAGPAGEVTSYQDDPSVLLAARQRLLAAAEALPR